MIPLPSPYSMKRYVSLRRLKSAARASLAGSAQEGSRLTCRRYAANSAGRPLGSGSSLFTHDAHAVLIAGTCPFSSIEAISGSAASSQIHSGPVPAAAPVAEPVDAHAWTGFATPTRPSATPRDRAFLLLRFSIDLPASLMGQ